MDPRNSQHVAGFRRSLQAWTDQRFISREDIEMLAMFSLYLVNLLDEEGRALYGHTYSQKGRIGCLVVKADYEGVPQVVFTNARTYPASIRVFLRRLAEGALDWRPDKYRS